MLTCSCAEAPKADQDAELLLNAKDDQEIVCWLGQYMAAGGAPIAVPHHRLEVLAEQLDAARHPYVARSQQAGTRWLAAKLQRISRSFYKSAEKHFARHLLEKPVDDWPTASRRRLLDGVTTIRPWWRLYHDHFARVKHGRYYVEPAPTAASSAAASSAAAETASSDSKHVKRKEEPAREATPEAVDDAVDVKPASLSTAS